MAPPGTGMKISEMNISTHQSELTTLKKSILWKIKGINSIRSANSWEAATCQMEIGDTVWRLHLFSDGKYLFGMPTLIEPRNKPIVYTLKTSIVNNNDFVIHTPYAANKTAVTAGANKDPHKWEIMKYGDATMDLFSNYVFDDTLKVLVDMTLHVQK
jgi:hypothetical protein